MIAICELSPIKGILINYTLISLTLVYVMALIHELIHGLVSILLGGKVVIGFKWVYAYTKEVSNKHFKRFEYVLILLAPVIIMTILLLPVNHWITNLVIIFNIMGSTGDIVMSLIVLKHGKNSNIISNNEGFEIIYNK